MKILFVEDELSKNIPRITRLFSKYLSKKKIRKLEELEADESGYGAEPEEVKAIVEESGLIELEYRFPDALRKIIHHHSNYVLFIIDRNLVECGYEFSEIAGIDPTYSKSQYHKFFDREGDYLLHKLLYSGVDVMSKFYFLTAYSAQNEIRGCEEIKTLIDFGKFNTENFIEKGGGKDFDRLCSVINNISILNLQHENMPYLNILRKNIGERAADNFLKIIEEKDDERRIGDNLKEMRNLYEQILKQASERIPNMKKSCENDRGNIVMGKITADWLSGNEHINIIIRNFFFSIKGIASDFGSHNNVQERSIYEPTADTVNSLVYALKDVISWFGKICSKYPKI